MVTSDCYYLKWKDNREKITQNKVASIYNMSACPQLLTHYTLKSV